jgi:2-polyprenyl-6-methoxyphenol hydroxylase-like FAD-dependent oxidoreductase
MRIGYDAIVVGARCGGAPTAMLLARRGYTVLLVDRATFPSDIARGHLIHRHGPRRLREWGLLRSVVATGCPPVTTFTLDLGDLRLVGEDLEVDGVALAYGPRRSALDKVLVDAAVDAGVEMREGFAVEEYLTEGDRVIGIRGRTGVDGQPITEHAALTIGADGRSSRLARTVKAEEYEIVPTLVFYYFSYWTDLPSSGLELYARRDRVIFAFPTNADAFAIFVGWPLAELRTVQADIETEFMAAIDLAPELAERVRAGKRAERFYGAANLPNFLRKPYGPGWALVGDAGCHKDPYLALGICDAFRDADLLVAAIDEGLSGRRQIDDAMAEYESRRNAATMQDYHQNIDMARFQPPPLEQRRILAALQGNQEATNQFFLAREGMIPPETFFNPENIRQILAADRSV